MSAGRAVARDPDRGLQSPWSASHVRVRYAETDQMGVVHHAAYLLWFEVGRTDWLRSAGLTYREMEAEGHQLPVVELQSRYHLPARYDDELVVRSRPARLTRVRITFEYEIVHADDGRLLVEGSTAHVVTDASSRPRRLPAGTFDRLCAAAGLPGHAASRSPE